MCVYTQYTCISIYIYVCVCVPGLAFSDSVPAFAVFVLLLPVDSCRVKLFVCGFHFKWHFVENNYAMASMRRPETFEQLSSTMEYLQ